MKYADRTHKTVSYNTIFACAFIILCESRSCEKIRCWRESGVFKEPRILLHNKIIHSSQRSNTRIRNSLTKYGISKYLNFRSLFKNKIATNQKYTRQHHRDIEFNVTRHRLKIYVFNIWFNIHTYLFCLVSLHWHKNKTYITNPSSAPLS